ncbi:MAG TPA: hypothetical protein VGM28_08980 [Candidatus Limnocylindrales bacterium]|jgi:hypothetical protein
MDIAVLVAFVACATVLALTIDLSDATVRTVGGLFHAPDLGWPVGVQEDDDMHWAWTGASVNVARPPRDRMRSKPPDPDPEPEVVDLEPSSIRLLLEPIHRTP